MRRCSPILVGSGESSVIARIMGYTTTASNTRSRSDCCTTLSPTPAVEESTTLLGSARSAIESSIHGDSTDGIPGTSEVPDSSAESFCGSTGTLADSSMTISVPVTTPAGRAIAGLLAILAEFEREILRERTRASLAQARLNDKRLGRPVTAGLHAAEIRKLHGTGVSKCEIARRVRIDRTSVRRVINCTRNSKGERNGRIENALTTASPTSHAIYKQLLAAIKPIGPYREEIKKTSIHLVRKSAFAGVHPRSQHLLLTIKAEKSIRSPRVAKAERVSKSRWHLDVKVSNIEEIDDELLGWLRQAYDLSA